MRLRKKILWLVSWYPNKLDAFDGDFIQRHARAAAIENDIHVIFVKDAVLDQAYQEEILHSPGLTEQIIYFKRPKGVFAKIWKQWLWYSYYRKAITHYLRQNGLPYLVHVHVPWKAGIMALWVKLRFKIPYIITEHWTIYNDGNPSTFDKKPLIIKKIYLNIFRNALGITPVSYDLGKRLVHLFNCNLVKVIDNVVEEKWFYYHEHDFKSFRFIHVSSLADQKNIYEIIEVFRHLCQEFKTVELHIVGPAPEKLIKLIKETGLYNRTIFVIGEKSYTEVAKCMQQTHCLLLFSHYENAPCVIGEALCCGLSVISSDVGGISELLDNSNGILVPPNNQKALSEAMKKMIIEYHHFDRRNIASDALSRFSNNTIGRQFANLYDHF